MGHGKEAVQTTSLRDLIHLTGPFPVFGILGLQLYTLHINFSPLRAGLALY